MIIPNHFPALPLVESSRSSKTFSFVTSNCLLWTELDVIRCSPGFYLNDDQKPILSSYKVELSKATAPIAVKKFIPSGPKIALSIELTKSTNKLFTEIVTILGLKQRSHLKACSQKRPEGMSALASIYPEAGHSNILSLHESLLDVLQRGRL